MSLVVVFDEGATPQKVLGVIRSANTPEWEGRTDALINPDLSSVEGIEPEKYWKVDTGAVVAFTAQEKADQDAADAAAADAAVRNAAKAAFDGQGGLALRALADIVKDEFNIVRLWTRDFKDVVAAAANLGQLQTGVAGLPTLADRTLAQLKAAIQGRVDDGTIDE